MTGRAVFPVCGYNRAMAIPRIYCDIPLIASMQITLDGQAHHHLCHVLRHKPGADIVLFNGRGGEYTATLVSIERKCSTATVREYVDADRESPLRIELRQGVSKVARMDYVIQKAVELGVVRIQPVLSRYSATAHRDWNNKLAHWRSVIVSACEQSGRTRIPELVSPLPLQECLSVDEDTLALVLDPRAARGFKQVGFAPRSLTLLIGPEGGLDAEEIAQAERSGFLPVCLGPRVLRTETAPLAALAAVQLLWGDLAPSTAR
jgi:16S rRNA (uracil1498-N3)-methyltransferase